MTGVTRPMESEIARKRALLDARTATLATRGLAAARVVETRPFLVCTCGEDRYGLPLGSVAQVLTARPCTPVPGAPSALLGIVALSGRVVSVLALAEALGRPPGASPESGHLVVLRGGSAPIALAVDRVVGVMHVASPVEAGRSPEESGHTDSGSGLAGSGLAGLGTEAVSGYAAGGIAPAPAGAGEAGFVIVDLPRLLRRFCP